MKTSKLWGSRLKKTPAKGLLEFTSGRDMKNTQPYDVIDKKEVRSILKGLNEVETAYLKGKFALDPASEDVHSTVEGYLIEHYGMESAGRLHAGRSRNDQVVVDMRLYLRAEVMDCINLLLILMDALTAVAKVHVGTVMPGYTHHQPAMVSSWGHLLFSYAVSLKRDVERLINWYTMFNINPLGGTAGYGTCLPLDRDLTAKLMGFDGVHESSLDPPQNRWEPEIELSYDISVMMNHLSNLAQTLIMLSTPGKAAYAHGVVMTLLSMGRSLFAGYNRDSQWSKYPVMDVIDECKPSLNVMKEIIISLKFDKKNAYRWCEKAFISATDVVEWLVQKHHLPFRDEDQGKD